MQGIKTAKFFERRGRRIEEFGGLLWHGMEKRTLIALPYHLDLNLSREDAERLLWKTTSVGLRYGSTGQAGSPGGIYTIRDKNYGLDNLSRSYCRDVKLGLKKCEVREVGAETLLREGLQLNVDTMQRQGRWEAEYGEPKQFERLVRAIADSDGVFALGSFVGERLGAYAICVREDGWLHHLHQFSLRELLKEHCNHTLCFEMVRTQMAHPEVEAFCDGFAPLVALEGLDTFKKRQGFALEARNTVSVLHPLIDRTVASDTGRAMLERLRVKRPEDQRIGRVVSIVDAARAAKQEMRMDEVCTQ